MKRIWQFFLDTLAPPDPEIRRIEGMSAQDFMAEALSAPLFESKSGSRRTSAPDGIVAFLPYRTALMKKALVEIKERENKAIGRLLGHILHICLTNAGIAGGLVIPTPITRKKKRERGWNQCELIAEGLRAVDADRLFEVRTDIMVKCRETKDQVGKGRAERFENLRESFLVPDPEKVRGRTVIVFDDIVTTGATLGEAKRALVDAGAQEVVCVALAY